MYNYNYVNSDLTRESGRVNRHSHLAVYKYIYSMILRITGVVGGVAGYCNCSSTSFGIGGASSPPRL